MSNSPHTADHVGYDQMNNNCNGNGNGFNSCNDNTNISNDCDGYQQSTNSPSTLSNNVPSSQTTSSLTTTNTNQTTNNGGDDVCRDFLRNVCRRGKACRFKHPDLSETEALGRKDTYVFCHDFQNRECRRDNCRFLHCTKQEEELFRSTGKLPSHVQSQASNDDSRNNLNTPICKDFLNGTCRRSPGRCKFRHPPQDQFNNSQQSNRNTFDNRNGQRNSYHIGGSNNSQMDYSPHYNRQCSSNMMPSNYVYENYSENPNKRKRPYDSVFNNYNGPYNEPMGQQVRGYSMHTSNQSIKYYGAPNQPRERSYLEEENANLRRRIDDLKTQVSDLIASNEFLVEQINQLRVQNAAGPAAAAVAVATATSVASLPPPPSACSVTTTTVGITAPLNLQAQIGPPPAAVIGALPPSSIVSSIASISLPTVTAPVSLVNSSASLASYTPSLHSSNPWPLGVDQ